MASKWKLEIDFPARVAKEMRFFWGRHRGIEIGIGSVRLGSSVWRWCTLAPPDKTRR